jgi:hypothetical protein
MKRGDVVVVPFPFQDRPGEKVRPAVVVPSDAETLRLANTILMKNRLMKKRGRSSQRRGVFASCVLFSGLRARIIPQARNPQTVA